MKGNQNNGFKTLFYVLGSFIVGALIALLIVQYFKEPIVRLILSQ